MAILPPPLLDHLRSALRTCILCSPFVLGAPAWCQLQQTGLSFGFTSSSITHQQNVRQAVGRSTTVQSSTRNMSLLPQSGFALQNPADLDYDFLQQVVTTNERRDSRRQTLTLADGLSTSVFRTLQPQPLNQ